MTHVTDLKRTSLAIGILCGAWLAASSVAMADSINIAAPAFVLRTASGSSDLVGEGGAGLLQNATGKYYAAVEFPDAGVNVCRFSMVYRDLDTTFNITAKLLKKTYVVGGSAFTAPVAMATLNSANAVDAVRRATTAVIVQPLVSTTRTFYYVELTVPFSALQVVGVEIVYNPTCP